VAPNRRLQIDLIASSSPEVDASLISVEPTGTTWPWLGSAPFGRTDVGAELADDDVRTWLLVRTASAEEGKITVADGRSDDTGGDESGGDDSANVVLALGLLLGLVRLLLLRLSLLGLGVLGLGVLELGVLEL
jgi:hypothetical protein